MEKNYITCKEYAELIKSQIKKEVDSIIKEGKDRPRLCVVQLGDDQASNSYIRGKKKDCEEVGIGFQHIHLSENQCQKFSQFDLAIMIKTINQMESIHGIIIQVPIPQKLDIEFFQQMISPIKDVDGFRKDSLHEPCTPKGIMDYLKYNSVDFPWKHCVVIGRSEIVGRPLVDMLIKEGATVTCCNSKTKDIKKFTKDADIVISAIGKANYFDKSYFSDGQILVDVGINRDENGKLCGDICSDAKENKLLATSVPGGVGLLTRVALLQNVMNTYKGDKS